MGTARVLPMKNATSHAAKVFASSSVLAAPIVTQTVKTEAACSSVTSEQPATSAVLEVTANKRVLAAPLARQLAQVVAVKATPTCNERRVIVAARPENAGRSVPRNPLTPDSSAASFGLLSYDERVRQNSICIFCRLTTARVQLRQ